jgi:hypothetical protein
MNTGWQHKNLIPVASYYELLVHLRDKETEAFCSVTKNIQIGGNCQKILFLSNSVDGKWY